MSDCQVGVADLQVLQAEQALVASDPGNRLIPSSSGPLTCRDPLHVSDEKYLDVGDETFELIKDL
jgi:hypothetical protein